MAQLVALLLILFGLYHGAKLFVRMPPAQLTRLVKGIGGLLTLAGAGLMLARGQIEVAVGIGGLGLYLLGFSGKPAWANRFGGARQGQARPGVRSASVAMELDRDSGAMEGRMLAGSFAGRSLAGLTRSQCEEALAFCRREDPDGARLLQTYLDRRFPGGRAAGDDNGHAGQRQPRAGAMTEKEAYEVLGLAPSATREDIARAHRTLMKKLHPDHGGSTHLAARVNEAKDVLMRRHV